MSLPPELAEAAEIDGASPFRTFFSVYAPLALPGLAIVGILAFNYHWNEFFRPLILTINRGELHPAARTRLAAGQPRHR